jgi:catechol 2,3-dioxygenase-like lactoylglutathione lyase family enzyme
MSIRSLFLVTLVVDDYDRALDFYCGIMGFELVSDTPLEANRRWVVVRPPGKEGAALLLARADGDAQTAAIGNQTAGRVSFFLKTDDFAGDHARLSAKGVCFIEEPRHEPYGTVAVFEDRYGNLWDLIQHADDAAS